MPSTMFERQEARRKFILEVLEEHPDGLRRKDIKTKWLLKGFPESTFHNVFYTLKNKGYIAKALPSEYFSPYVITAIGKRYLNGLRA